MEQINEMTVEQLKSLKAKWYKDATDQGLINKLWEIAENLGERLRHNYGPKYEFKYEDVRIYVDNYGNYMTVHKGERLVVSTHNERLYVFGILEPLITVWYPEAEKKMQQE